VADDSIEVWEKVARFSHPARSYTLWHFWLTTTGIAVFFLAFYLSGSYLPGSRSALWVVLAD